METIQTQMLIIVPIYSWETQIFLKITKQTLASSKSDRNKYKFKIRIRIRIWRIARVHIAQFKMIKQQAETLNNCINNNNNTKTPSNKKSLAYTVEPHNP